MADKETTKDQLLSELTQLRQRLAEMERLVTEHHKTKGELRQAAGQYETWMEAAPVMIFRSSLKAVISYVNKKFEEVTGYSREEIIGRHWFVFDAFSPEDTKALLKRMKLKLMGEPTRPMEVRMKRRDGAWIWVSGVGELIKDKGRPVGIQIIAQDVTESKQDEEMIRWLAYYDKVTGLPNRELFNDRVNSALAHAARDQHKLSVMMLDLDGFKDVNDRLGHGAGDVLLKFVGERVVSCLRKSDTVARMGGDEFMVLLPKVSSVEDAMVVAQKIMGRFQEPFGINDHTVRITTSIGITLYPDHGQDANTLVMNADIAMYLVKQAGKDSYTVFGLKEQAKEAWKDVHEHR